MKTLSMFLLIAASTAQAQLVVGFESFSLAPNSAYGSPSSAPFQVAGLTFNHIHSFNLWYQGFSYTNKYDSTNGTYSNLYGVRPYKGVNQSATYAVGQNRGVISVSSSQNTITGMYVTNATYAYKTIRDGDSFSRKFGDTTGTGSGTTIAQGAYPDFFKLVIRAYSGGTLKNDSVVFFLADYRGTSDYIVDSWQFVNTASLGAADSLEFTLRSSDNNQFGMKTPAFFAIDDVQVALPNPVGIGALSFAAARVAPQPFQSFIAVTGVADGCRLTLCDLGGRAVKQADAPALTGLDDLAPGIYLMRIDGVHFKQTVKVIKE